MENMHNFHGTDLVKFFIGGNANLVANKEMVNALNVFPVPDGDTGTNMSLTMGSAVASLAGLTDIHEIGSTLAKGALMGARGNSGVILSQILRGFSQALAESTDTIGGRAFGAAMGKGVELAYKSVMRPVEGTILSVAKAMAQAAAKTTSDDVIEVLKIMLEAGKIALAKTPEQLPVLKQAGVVDAGGQGLIVVFEGGLAAVTGKAEVSVAAPAAPAKTAMISDVDDHSDLKYCYCTEFFIHGENIDVNAIREHLADMGDSQVIVGDESMVKTHIHTDNPGAVLAFAIQFGSLHDLKIDNMKDQHRNTLFEEGAEAAPAEPEVPAEPLEGCGVVAVSCGEGLDNIFTELGAGALISGGQSMNPGVEDILKAINEINTAEVIILPNNSNIIMAAEQAKTLSDKPVHVVPTKYLLQGVTALMFFDPGESGEANAEAMTEAFANMKTAEITYAVRDSEFDGLKIHEGDYLGLFGKDIKASVPTIDEAVYAVLDAMVDGDSSMITVLYGEDVKAEEAEAMQTKLQEKYPDVDIEMQYGGQPVYFYLISVE